MALLEFHFRKDVSQYEIFAINCLYKLFFLVAYIRIKAYSGGYSGIIFSIREDCQTRMMRRVSVRSPDDADIDLQSLGLFIRNDYPIDSAQTSDFIRKCL